MTRCREECWRPHPDEREDRRRAGAAPRLFRRLRRRSTDARTDRSFPSSCAPSSSPAATASPPARSGTSPRARRRGALPESEQRFRHALADSPITVFEQDAAPALQWVFNSKLGYSDTFCIGKTDHEIMDPAAAEVLTAFKQSVLRQRRVGPPGGDRRGTRPAVRIFRSPRPSPSRRGRARDRPDLRRDGRDRAEARARRRCERAKRAFRTLVGAAELGDVVLPAIGPSCRAAAGVDGVHRTCPRGGSATAGPGLHRRRPPACRQATCQDRGGDPCVARRSAYAARIRRTTDPNWRWMRVSGGCRSDVRGGWRAERLGAWSFDITERKRAEERLRAAHDTFRIWSSARRSASTPSTPISGSSRSATARRRCSRTCGRSRAGLRRGAAHPLAGAVRHARRSTASATRWRPASPTMRRAPSSGAPTSTPPRPTTGRSSGSRCPTAGPGVVCHFYDLSERQRHEEHVRLLMREVNHRSKNLLALIQAIARQTAASGPDDFVDRFGERVQALAAAQDLLVSNGWEAVPLADLVRCAARPLRRPDRPAHRRSTGPPVHLTPGGDPGARHGAARARHQRRQVRRAVERDRSRRDRLELCEPTAPASRGSRSPGRSAAARRSPRRSGTASAPP